jgi:N6-L-threonylcarbamoyladenine synthase
VLILGIETSCDETAAAVVRDDGLVLSDVVHSQVELHAPYGGIVPELASRAHLRNIRPVIVSALEGAGKCFEDIDGVAVTCRPGLSGALLVGVQAARALAWAAEKPVVGVDHLFGHVLAAFLRYPDSPNAPRPDFPFVALLASGGHTALYRVSGPELDDTQELGATRDDAAGEAFDKVSKLLGLGYPGGPVIDRLSAQGDPNAVALAHPMRSSSSLEFSFSGLKTDVARRVVKYGRPGNDQQLYDLCAAFQQRVVDVLLRKTLLAVRQTGVDTLVFAGGVAANRQLRRDGALAAERQGLRLIVPPFRACTDNAAMIAYAGARRLARGENQVHDLQVSPRSALVGRTRKGPGKRDFRQAGAKSHWIRT